MSQTEGDTPPQNPHRVIAEVVKELRKGRGWSAQRLAEEMSKAGIPWDRSIVANFESGRRQAVSVEEFLALAYVLSVAPIHLVLSPASPALAEYQVTPTVTASTGAMRLWIDGTWPLAGVDPWLYFRQVPEGERMPDEELARAVTRHKPTMRPITPADVPGGDDGQRQ